MWTNPTAARITQYKRKCVTSGKTQYIYITYILCVDDDSGDTQHKMKAGDVTVYNSGQREGEEDGTDSLHLGWG